MSAGDPTKVSPRSSWPTVVHQEVSMLGEPAQKMLKEGSLQEVPMHAQEALMTHAQEEPMSSVGPLVSNPS
jgi:hypothetical protein